MEHKPERRRAAVKLPAAMVMAAILLAMLGGVAAAAESSGTGLNLNAYLGAERFYDAGFTGGSTIQANIEGGHAWDGHESLGHISVFIDGDGDTGYTAAHATATAQLLGGRPTGGYDGADVRGFGIAFDATLWSGSFGWDDGEGGFDTDARALGSTYVTALHEGVDGQTPDVINGSWGISADGTGRFTATMGIDGMINGSSAGHVAPVAVWSAGNSGSDSNTVSGPATGYNNISVGGLQGESTTPPYNHLWGQSSRGPQDFAYDDGTIVEGVRAPVDIAAPATQIRAALTTSNESGYPSVAGTSAAAPLVAGGASLMVDAGKDTFSDDPHAVDARVIKATLLNSADKTADWSNGQQDVDGVVRTTQSLDWAMGTGRMNLDRAFDQYVAAGTTGVEMGSGSLGVVADTGWDYGYVNDTAMNTYFIGEMVEGGSDLTATLTWFADRDPGALDLRGPQAYFQGASDEHFANLELSVFRFDDLENMNVLDVVAESISTYNPTEHLHFELDESGFYGLGVTYSDPLWNHIDATGEYYGLAWSVDGPQGLVAAVPSPTTAAMGSVLLAALVLPRRRRA